MLKLLSCKSQKRVLPNRITGPWSDLVLHHCMGEGKTNVRTQSARSVQGHLLFCHFCHILLLSTIGKMSYNELHEERTNNHAAKLSTIRE